MIFCMLLADAHKSVMLQDLARPGGVEAALSSIKIKSVPQTCTETLMSFKLKGLASRPVLRLVPRLHDEF